MPFQKHFCKHKQLLRTLASFNYPATFLNVVAFPVFIFPPPGHFAQQTGCFFFFPFGSACPQPVSQEVQHWWSLRGAVLKAPGWSWGCCRDWEETRVLRQPAALLTLAAERETQFSLALKPLWQCQGLPFSRAALHFGVSVCPEALPAGSRGETAPGNYRQSAWKIPGSLIYSQNMFV